MHTPGAGGVQRVQKELAQSTVKSPLRKHAVYRREGAVDPDTDEKGRSEDQSAPSKVRHDLRGLPGPWEQCHQIVGQLHCSARNPREPPSPHPQHQEEPQGNAARSDTGESSHRCLEAMTQQACQPTAPWASSLTSLSSGFLPCKIRSIIIIRKLMAPS